MELGAIREMPGINTGGWTPSEVIGGLTLAFAVLSAISWLIYLIINDPADRRAIGAWLEKARLWEGYRRGVGWGLERLERFYGGSFSWRAFDRCLVIAFFYPIILYIVAWAAGGFATLSDLFQLPSDWPWWQRWLLTILLLCAGVLVVWLILNHYRIGNAAREITLRRLNRADLSRKSVWILRGVAVSAAGVVAYLATDLWNVATIAAVGTAVGLALSPKLAIVLAFAVITAVSIAISLAVDVTTGVVLGTALVASGAAITGAGLARGGAGAVVGVILGAVVVTATLTLTGVWIVDFNLPVGWIFFLVLLPFVNTVPDYLSLGVSRKLLQAVAENTSHWRLARHVGYDILWAFFFLFLLAGLLLSGTVLYAQQTLSWLDVGLAWQPLLRAARDEPLGGGLSVTMMLFSTLVPTFAHLLVAAAALLVRPLPGQHTIAAWLVADGSVQTSRKIGAVAWIMMAVIGGLTGLTAVGYGIWTLLSFLSGETIGEYLYAFATCSAALVSDVPCVRP